MKVDKRHIVLGALWTTLSSGFSTLIKLITIPILARILLPEDFGNVAVPMALIAFTSMIIGNGGYGAAIVYYEKEDNIYRNTVFWLNLFTGFVVFILFYINSSKLATFFGVPDSSQYLEVLSLLTPVIMIASVGYFILMKDMKFHLISRAMIISTIISSVAALVFAYKGFGAWSLVIQHLVYNLLLCILFYIEANYIPQFKFSFAVFKMIFPYAMRVTLSDGLMWLSTDGPLLVVARLSGVSNSGVYSVIARLSHIPREMLGTGLENALFSGLVNAKADEDTRQNILLWSMKVNIYVLGSVYCGIAALSKLIVPVVLGPNFSPYWEVLYWLAIGMMFMTPASGYASYLKALNELKVMLKLSILRTVLIFFGLFIGWTIDNSLLGIVRGIAASQIILSAILIVSIFKLCDISYSAIMRYLYPSISIVVLTGAAMYFTMTFCSVNELSDIVSLLIPAFVGGMVFFVLVRLFTPQDYRVVINHIFKR